MAEQDWHNAKIISELRIRANRSLRKLSEDNALSPNTLSQALQRPYPKAESIIAKAIGVSPSEIWPSRYNSDGTTSRRKGRRKGKRSITKNYPKDTAIGSEELKK